MKTTENVSKAGLYTSTCCQHDQLFSVEDVFQRCPHCKSLCDWEVAEAELDSSQTPRKPTPTDSKTVAA